MKHRKDGDGGETVSGQSNVEASANCNTLLESLTLLSKGLKDFKQDIGKDLNSFKSNVKKTMKDDLVKTVEHRKDGDDEETMSGKANVEASINCNALLESLKKD